MKPLYTLPIHELHRLRLQRETTTTAIVRSVLDRIEETESRLHSFLYRCEGEAMQAAAAVDAKMAADNPIGILEGIPIGIKDLFSTRGIPTTCASKILKDYCPPFESTVTRRLLDAGMIMIGKTNMDEFAMGSSTENSAFGCTHNPWALDRVPGGSSGGSAAAVAAGQALAAIGTDTGGSIRQPASFTGIVGLKPTYGRVSRWGMVAFASSFDQAGPMTTDVTDAALLLGIIAGYDSHDATSLQTPVPDYVAGLNRPVQDLKIGVISDLDLSSCDEEVARIFTENIKVLEGIGATIIPVRIPNLRHAVATYYVIAPCEASSNLGRYDGVRYGHRTVHSDTLIEMYENSREEGFGNEVKIRILIGTFALSAGYYDAYYLKAQKIQNLIRAQFNAAFERVDAIASPVAPTAAYRLGEMSDDPLKMYLGDAFTIPANLAGVPAISVPGGFTADGLPVGFQLIANHLQEEKLLRIARCFESERQLVRPAMPL
jgi:aspartyl-tRNA(Asn)/glutamyl-tRNA(Gln) amidotransferase subunit A